MRLLLLSALIALAPSVAAQSEFVRDAGPYAVLDALDVLRLGDDQLEVGAGGGWRFGNGLDVGVRVGADHTSLDVGGPVSESRRLALALEVGYTAWLGERTGLQFALEGALAQTVEIGAPSLALDGLAVIDRGNTDRNEGGAEISATVFRRVVVRDVTVQPSVGAFLGGVVTASAPSDRPFTLRADTGTSGGQERMGVTLGLPVLFRAGAVHLAVGPDVRIDVAQDRVGGGLRLRANF
ncbi:hypothetical protein [Rubrivirga sp.]|uniref:hypothetical protein n=1 Tax=Rubrivirga sp. TaxID=1885344 RepID=UPI003C77116D